MSDLSQRIVTSHKEAAKRAAAHLKSTRNMKLSSVESLELVARTLGVANWPTLQAMAKEGRGPRIDDGKAPVSASAAVPVQTKSVVEMLKDYYGTSDSWGECPSYTREQWRDYVSDDYTLLGYWETVEIKLNERGEMLPWERDADDAVKVAKEAGLNVVHGTDYEHAENHEEEEWFVVDKDGDALFDPEQLEQDAWKQAAAHVLQRALDKADAGHKAIAQIQGSSVSESVERLTAFFADQPKKRPGAMTEDERKGSEHVSLAWLAGRYVHYERKTEDDFFPGWSVFDAAGNDLIVDCETESEAWELAAIEVRNEVCQADGLSVEQWKAMWLRDRLGRVAQHYGVTEISRFLSLTVTEENVQNTEAVVSFAKAAATKVEQRAEGWVVYESCAWQAIHLPPQKTEGHAWLQAAFIVFREVLLRTEMTQEAFFALPAEVKIRHVQETYKGRSCWIR